MTMKCSYLLSCSILALGLAAPAFATDRWGLNDSEEPGSVLVFHKFEAFNSDKTSFEINVTCPPPDDPFFDCGSIPVLDNPRGGTVYLKGHWVCKGPVTVGEANEEDTQIGYCKETDFTLQTTVNGTIIFNTNNDDPKNHDVFPPCHEGYLIAWMTDISGNPIKFDGLIGAAVVEDGSGSIAAYAAYPIQAGQDLQTLASTELNSNGSLDFDGNEYKKVTGKIYGSVSYDNRDEQVETSLILLTLDVKSGDVNPLTSVGLQFYSREEDYRSADANFYCWREFDLRDFDAGLDESFEPKGKGLLKSGTAVQDGNPATLLAILETDQYRDRVAAPAKVVTGTGTASIQINPAALPANCKSSGGLVPIITCSVSVNTQTPVPAAVIGEEHERLLPLFNDSEGHDTTFVPEPHPF